MSSDLLAPVTLPPDLSKAIADELERIGEYGRVLLIKSAGRVSRIEGTRYAALPSKEQQTLGEDEAA